MNEPRIPTVDAPATSENGDPSAWDRAISPVGRKAPGQRGRILALVALLVGCAALAAATWRHGPKPAPIPATPARQVVDYPGPAAPTLASPGPNPPQLGAGHPTSTADPAGAALPPVPALDPSASPHDPAEAARASAHPSPVSIIRAAPLLAFSRGGGVSEHGEPVTGPSSTPSPTELDGLRHGSAVTRQRAGLVGDRNFLLLAGTSIPCILQTALDSATPGYVSCLIPGDIYSDNGAVVLLERGTRVLGEYRSGQRQGQGRLFVLWTRAVTPQGVSLALASPATDALGRAGFDGELDTHFWDRFAGAVLLSVIDGASDAVDERARGALRRPSDAAATAVQASSAIGPSLRKPQGAEVAILTAQDFDFSGVYALKAR